MANIFLAKVGQKILFNRDCEEAKRSNANGSVGISNLVKLLIENGKEHTWFLMSESNYSGEYQNVIDCQNISYTDFMFYQRKIEYGIIISGMPIYKGNRCTFIDKLKEFAGIKTILLNEDPRCLEAMCKFGEVAGHVDNYVDYRPFKIFGLCQYQQCTFNDITYDVEYIPLEHSLAFRAKVQEPIERKGHVIISNTVGNNQREKIIEKLVADDNIQVFGRFENLKVNNYCGEVKYEDIQNIMSRIQSTLILPNGDWVTGKYIECLCYNVLPVFYSTYDTDLIFRETSVKSGYKIAQAKGRNSYRNILGIMDSDDAGIQAGIIAYIKYLHKLFILPNVSGKPLYNKIINELI